MDICLLGESLHAEGHFLIVDELCDIDYEGVDVVSAVLFFEEAGGAGKALSALRLPAEIFECLGGVFGTADLMV